MSGVSFSIGLCYGYSIALWAKKCNSFLKSFDKYFVSILQYRYVFIDIILAVTSDLMIALSCAGVAERVAVIINNPMITLSSAGVAERNACRFL